MTSIVLKAVGDIFLKTKKGSNPFMYITEILHQNDVLFGNLEASLTSSHILTKKAVSLVADTKSVAYLKEAGFDILNIANNHILDSGIEGFNDTIHVLNENDIRYVGASPSKSNHLHMIIEKNNLRFGFLGYTTGRFKVPNTISVNKLVKKKIISDIETIKDDCDFIIVSLHWGIENVSYPSPDQIELAHSLIDNGVSLILGHHPHILQGIEEYHNGLIVYSLGNFQFSPPLSQIKTNESMIFSVRFEQHGIKEYEIIPVEIDDNYVPHPVEGHKKNEIIESLNEISKKLNDQTLTRKWWYEEIASTYLSNNLRSYKIRIKKYGIKPLMECMIWLVTPFCIQCYLGVIRKRLNRVVR